MDRQGCLIPRRIYKTVLDRLALFPAVILPNKCFVVHAGEERYPVSQDAEAIGVLEMAREILDKGGV